MTQHFDCSHCGHQFAVESPSKTTICPDCGKELVVPDLSNSGTSEDGPGTETNFDFLHEQKSDSEKPQPERKHSESVFDDSGPNLGSGVSSAVLPKLEAPGQKTIAPSPAVTTQPRSTSVKQSGRGLLFWLVLSYASAVTIVCAWLVWQLYFQKPHDLESLPDIPPQAGVKLFLIPENASMAPGHTLKIGETQRFGNLKIHVVKVTQGPLREIVTDTSSLFEDQLQGKSLQLWLELTNVSEGQSFVPLDYDLVMNRSQDDAADSESLFRANNFVSNVNEKHRNGLRVLMFHPSRHSSAALVGQSLGEELKPGETITTYLATESQDVEELEGELVWRVHFRKGHHPESGRGVTSVIEVRFHQDDIQTFSREDRT